MSTEIQTGKDHLWGRCFQHVTIGDKSLRCVRNTPIFTHRHRYDLERSNDEPCPHWVRLSTGLKRYCENTNGDYRHRAGDFAWEQW